MTYGQIVTEEPLAGLDGPIEIIRDQIGVPHCYAATEHDAFFAQGWVHATDRLWQMESDRRRALGRWAEVVGSAGVASDLFYRRIDLASTARRDWAALAPRTKAMLEAYSAGANAGAKAKAGRRLPRDLQLAGVVPETWEPWHSLLVFKVRHVLMGSARQKLWRAVAVDVLGADAAKWMLSRLDHLACVPPGAACDDLLSVALADEAGSNNWALSGRVPPPVCPCWPATPTASWSSPTFTSRATCRAQHGTCWASAWPVWRASPISAITKRWPGASPTG